MKQIERPNPSVQDRQPASKQNLFKRAISICLLTMLALGTIQPGTAIAADDWMKLEVRGMTPSMTFAEVKAHLQKNWPTARLKVRYNHIRHVNSRYKYAHSISIRDYSTGKRENFRIMFLPPETITDDPETVKIKRLIRDQDIKDTPVLRDDFISQLTSKYGEPTFIDQTKLQWVYNKDRIKLSSKKLSAQKKAIELRCEQIRQAMNTYTKTAFSDGSIPTDYNQRVGEISKQQKKCYHEQVRIKNCFRSAAKKLCPYRMTISWRERSDTKGFVPAYVVNLNSVKFHELEKQRIANLKDQLMNKALEETEQKAKSAAKLNL